MAEHTTEKDAPQGWMSDFDSTAPVEKRLFSDPSIGNCPGCSNVRWHAKRCPWLAGYRAHTPPAADWGEVLREALTPPLMDMLIIRFPAWGRDGTDYRYAEFIDRIAEIAADAGCVLPPEVTPTQPPSSGVRATASERNADG